MSSKVFTYIWEYRVKPEHVDAFEHAYGSNGDWVRLFKKGTGHISTELHQDINHSDRFITIDCWTSKEAFDKFKKQFHEEFKTLDERFETFTTSEKHIGDFEGYIKKYHKE
ncbi:MAG: antibiotic biosynthesis monooxygenase family protein [Cyclobacteriaceae bacterium]